MLLDPPEPWLPERPSLTALCAEAWRSARGHITHREGLVQSPYMDEGFDPERIWIWDTCLMAHYCALAPDVFPGIESLDNFYGPLHEGADSALLIHHSDNPPLFAWTEWVYFRHTGDLDRVRRVLDSGVLQRHSEWFDTVGPGQLPPHTKVPTAIQRTPDGYRWSGVCSGMDNTPRAPFADGPDTVGPVFWFDAMAQQALSALCIARLASAVGDQDVADAWTRRHGELCAELHRLHWSEELGCHVDRLDVPGSPASDVITPAIFWPLLAGAVTEDQARRIVGHLLDPQGLGGVVPWPSVERRHPAFRDTGHYWRGGVWVPLAYVSASAMAEHGFGDVAHEASLALLDHMATTFQACEPHTIWEAYSPTAPGPATAKDDVEIVRPDFCGWSALGPTAMLVEHVLGFAVDAPTRTVRWTRRLAEDHGISRLRCGDAVLDVRSIGGRVSGTASAVLRLVVDGVPSSVGPGEFTVE